MTKNHHTADTVWGTENSVTFTGKEWCKSQWLAHRGLMRGFSETGYSYFGARFYDSDLNGLFLSVDPMADKYPGISPYAYCAWNSVRLVDPNGKEIILKGSDECIKKAIELMSKKSNLSFSVDEKGKVSYSGEATTEIEVYMAEMINNTEITVNLTVQESGYDDEWNKIYGGCFNGNKFKSGTTDQINCYQIVDLITAQENDLLVGKDWLGQTIWHEIAEAFEGGRNSIKNKIEANKAYSDENNPEYIQAHDAASKHFPASPKPIIETNKLGFMVYSRITGYVFE